MFHFDKDFVDKNGERYMFPVRIQSLMKDLLNKYVIRREYGTGDFQFFLGDVTYTQLNENTPWIDFRAGKMLWGEPDQWAWFRQTITIPEDFAGEDIWYAVFPYTTDIDWHWGHPQAQLFVNGKCVFGIDCNHRKYLLLKNAKGGETLEIAIKVYSDLTYFAGQMTMSAKLQVMRPRVYELYQSLAVPMRAVSYMNSDSIERVEIVKKLNQAMNILNIGEDPDSDAFLDSVAETEEFLRTELYGTMRSGSEPVLWSIGHSHIDVAWQWTYHVSRNKAARTFATNLRLLEENPDYLFMSSQPVLYEYVKEDQPELYEQVKQRIAEGRWEPEGGMYVESDTNLTGGESLVRQFLVGKRFFRKEFGKDNKILWLPDVFGYSANLPQICKRSGIDYFYTTKIGWNEYNKFPYDTFRWRGLDGSTVLTHFGCAIQYADIETDWMTTYNPSLEPSFVLGAWRRYQQKDINRDLLYDFGYGDGGGVPTQEMIDYGRRFQAGIPGCPTVKFAKTLDYFKHLEADVADDPHLPEWDGEMYLEFHRGTYTSQGKTKKNNRRSEQLYHDVENLWSFAKLLNADGSYPAEKLEENWKLILLNQFHDVLPGSSIAKVYEDAQQHYDQILGQGGQMRDEAASLLASMVRTEDDSVVVFNTMSFERSPVVICDDMIEGLVDADGNAIPCQKTHDGKTVFIAPNVPAKGWKTFRIGAAAPAAEAVHVSASGMETDGLRVSFDEKMHITSLYSKAAGRETLPQGTVSGRLIAYDDVARNDDNWNVQAYYHEKYRVIDDVTNVQVLESGPVRGVLCVDRKFRSSSLRTYIIAYAGSDALQFDYEIDWQEHNLFVKAEHPVDVNAKNASYEIQFGYVQRPVHKNTLWDFARFEVCGHKYADLSDGGFGMAILNDCKYGFDATRNSLNITLLKCSTYPDKQADIGHHSFSYALYPHDGDLLAARVRDRAYDFNFHAPAVQVPVQQGVLPGEMSVLSVSAPNVVIETVKKAEDSDDIVIRMYEAENKKTECVLHTAFALSGCVETNLMEEPEQELPVDGNTVALSFRPFEIKTVIIRK
mgnify:CR=1 FL=1